MSAKSTARSVQDKSSKEKSGTDVPSHPPPMPRFNDDIEAEECVVEVIQCVMDGVNLNISARCAQIIENGLAAEIAMYKLQEVIQLATVQHDGVVEPNKVLELLLPDEEPVPAPIDNWARGAVTSRVVKVKESRFNDSLGRSDGTPSVSSIRSASTRSRSTAHSRMSNRDRPMRPMTSQGDNTDSAPRIIELDDESANYFAENGGNMNGTGHMYDMLQKQKNRLKQLTHTDDTVKDEFQLMQEEVDRAKEDLKGKNYIFDQNGQILLIQPLKSEQLPPFAYCPSLNVSNSDSTESKKKSISAPLPKKKKKLRVAGTRGVDSSGDSSNFIPTTSLATTIASNSHEMFLSQGVAIQTNKISKEGPPIPEDPNKPSRKEYFNRKLSSTMSAAMDASWDDNIGSREDSLHSNSFDSYEQSLGMADKSSTLTAGNRFKDIDPFEGGRPKPPPILVNPPDTNRSRASSRRDSGDVDKIGKKNPPVEPTKPSLQQQTTINLLHGGSLMQGPRDRLPSQVLNTRAEKKKYVIPTKSLADETDAQSFNSNNSKKSTGSIKKEKIAHHLF